VAWDKLGGATGSLGAPMADQTENGNVITQRFSGGVVSWDRSKNSFSTEPANLASQLAGLQVPGQEAPKAPPPNPAASDDHGRKWFAWSWWWLLAIIPVVVLAGLVVVAATRNRRGRDDDDIFDDDDDEFESSYPEDQSDELFSNRYAHQGLGSPPSMNVWGAPQPAESSEQADEDDEADTTRERVAAPEAVVPKGNDEDSDEVDTTPTRVPTSIERNPLTDTGRHARIEVDEPAPNGTALHLPLDDPNEAPDGYPIKADTKTGLYWAPGTTLYDDARAEIWFASEELARTNGFVRAN
jgi:uncharacterized protein with LGFP repeats